jgi:nucleotide-binding universal stress UspA family protein
VFKHLLVPIDDSPRAAKAARAAAGLARPMRARITLLHVIPPFMPPVYDLDVMPYSEVYSPSEYRKRTEKHAEAMLARAAKAIAKGGRVRVATAFVTAEEPWRAIIKAARAYRCDAVVMASHGRRGIAAVVLGSETTKVLTHSKVPVLVVR